MIKKTYIPGKPRNPKLSTTAGTSGVGKTEFNQVAGSSHEHPNKDVLDLISQSDIDVLNLLSVVDGNIKVDTTLWATGGISAFGLGEDGGGGTGYDRLDAWADYDSSKSGWVLSALLGADLNTRLSNVESGSATSITTTGSGNAITSISKSGNVITANKGSKFAELGEDGLILTSQLPSYVDDVLEFDALADFPTTGEPGKIYVATNTNLTYRWTGTTYVEISKSIALGTTSSTAYRGDHGLIAYNHSQSEHQTIINGTGFVKANGKTLSYDNTTYEPAFTKNTAFNKNFGTTAGTVAQGNDSRIINGQTAYGWGDHSSAGYALNSALTAHIDNADNPHSVTKAQVGLGNVDNVKQATKTEFDTHTANSTIHITSTERTNWNDANSKKHTHGNKTIIDKLTQGNIDVLSKLSIDADGNLKIDANAYATGELSAYGAGAGGGDGSSYNRLDAWADYDSSKSGWVLSALLGNELNTRVGNLEGGSALTVNTTGTGNAITSISKAGTVITANKDLTFSLSGHTHAISDVTGLQTTLNSKLETSIFNTHNNDNVRHITGAERTKWDGVVTDFGNLEIGGRNLIPISKISAHGSSLVELEQEYQGAPVFKNTVTSPNTSNNFGYRFANLLVLSESTSFTLSLNYNITSYAGTGSDALRGYIRVVYFDDTTEAFNFGNRIVNPNDSNNLNKWHKLEFTFTPTKEIKAFSNFYFFGDYIGAGSEWLLTPPKLEKGTIPTDWTPAPEDQVSDWNTTDVNSFSFIKNKPTLLSQFTDNIGVATHIANKSNPHSVTKAQVGLGNVDNTPDSAKNVLSATKLTTARTIAGVSFDGTANIAIPFANLSSKPTTLAGYGITDAYTKTEVDTALALKLNKSVFDDLFEKVEVSAGVFAIKAKYDFYSVGEVSAYGLGSGGSGGGGYDRLDTWADYDSSKAGWVLSALLGVDLNNRLSNVEGGSATSVSVTGTGDVLTNVTKSGNNLNFTRGNQTWANLSGKPATFTPSAHNHPISDITGLQAALNAKEGTITAGTTAQYWRGDKSWQTLNTTVVPEGTNLYYTNARVKAYADTLYSPLGHTHTISDITNLQTTLNNKLETSIFNTHNNDNVRHITGAERTKWDTVVTDFAGLEIGGRNLLPKSNIEYGSFNYITGININSSAQKRTIEPLEIVGGSTYYLYCNLEPKENHTYPGEIAYYFYDKDMVGIIGGNVTNPVKPIAAFIKSPVNARYLKVRFGGVETFLNDKYMVVRSTTPTDWTPAPEDQVSDWNTTDVNSFSFIKNKPTLLSQFTDNIGVAAHIANKSNPHSVTKAQVGLGNVDNTSDSEKNVLSATKLTTARTIWGQSFNGEANVSGAMTGVTSLAMTGALSGATTITASTSVATPKVIFNSAGWSMEQVGNELQMKHNNVLKMRFTSTGSIIATEEITAFG